MLFKVNPVVKRTRVKICGITRPEDAQAAINAGADALGLVFWQPSARAVTIEQAERICAKIPAFVSVVALTVNAEQAFINQIVSALPIDLLQFHGDESPEHCQSSGRPYIKAIRMRPELNLQLEIDRFPGAKSILLDAYKKGTPGGTGESFDWELIPEQYRSRIILAGGLNPHNIRQAITAVRPYAVDVSGGVELAAGVKDINKINQFMYSVDQADSARLISNGGN